MNFKKMFLHIAALGLTIAGLSGCNIVHVHDYDAPFQYDEAKHWQICDGCYEILNEGSHAFNNFNDTCLICGYKDPTVIVDSDGLMTGLTMHGKAKYEIDIPTNVKFITKDALKDSNVTRVNIPKEFVGYYEGAFDYNNINIVTDEENVTWTYINGIYYKHNVLEEYEAVIDDKCFVTLKEAFESVHSDDLTIIVTRKELVISESLPVNRVINLKSYFETTILECNFQISGGGILNIDQSIELNGSAQLMLANCTEERNESYGGCYKTGTIAFIDRETKPENVYVEYVKNFRTGVGCGYEAVGSKQVVNNLLVIPVQQYAYGTFAFSTDFKSILGLSPYGEKVSELHITNVVKNINATIADYAFAIWTDIKINIAVIDDTHIKFFQTKGFFTSVYIENGITSIGYRAFSNETNDDIFHEVKKMIAILSRIQSVYIGDSVTHIGNNAFACSLSLEEVYGGRGLVEIGENAFNECLSLRSADFSEAFKLAKINKYAFANCDNFVQLAIPGDNWNIFSRSFVPHQFSGDIAARYATKDFADVIWTRTIEGNICYTHNLLTDDYGKFRNVNYTYSIDTAISNCCDNGWVYILDSINEETKNINYTSFSKNLNIVAYEAAEGITIGAEDKDFVVQKNHYLTLDNITPLKGVCIECLMTDYEDNSIMVTEIGTFAMKVKNNETYLNTLIYFKDPAREEKMDAKLTPASFKEGIEYMTCGLFSFNYNYEIHRIIFDKKSFLLDSVTSVTFDSAIRNNEDQYVEQVTIWGNFFEKHSEIKFLNFSDLVTDIGNYAFVKCPKLETVTFGTGIQRISYSAFGYCQKLRRVELGRGNNLEYIGEGAFGRCDSLAYFNFNGNIRDWSVEGQDVHEVVVTADQISNPYSAVEIVKQYDECNWHAIQVEE